MSTQIIPDLVSDVANELSIDINNLFMEVSNTKLKIMSSIMNISDLAVKKF